MTMISKWLEWDDEDADIEPIRARGGSRLFLRILRGMAGKTK